MTDTTRQALDAELELNEKLRGEVEKLKEEWAVAHSGWEKANDRYDELRAEVERLKDELEQQDQVNGCLLSENISHCGEIRRLGELQVDAKEACRIVAKESDRLRAEVERLKEDLDTMDGIAQMHSRNHVDAKCEVERLKVVNGDLLDDDGDLRALIAKLRGYADHKYDCQRNRPSAGPLPCNCGLAALEEKK